MSARRSALKQVIDSVADGRSDLDWARLEQQVGTERDRALLRQLRVVSQLSAIQRAEIGRVDEDAMLASANAVARLHAKTVTADLDLGASQPWSQAERRPTLPARSWGRFQLRERLGEGTFGEVYRAFDPQLEREVAVKLLHVGKPAAMKRVLTEARALARVRHPNVVVVHDAEARDGRVGLCMEFIRGRTLANLLKAHGTLGATEATSIGQALCRALAAVHYEGLLHGDVKAHNVMREEGGRIVLMDFGAGRRRDVVNEGPASLTGTPLYLAPEVLDGAHATVQSDIYSLGVLLYHLVTNGYPVTGTSLDELKAAHRHGRRIRLHDVRSDLPEAFVRVVERAIDPDPRRRFQSAGELGEALGGPHVVPRAGPMMPIRWWVALAAAAVAVWAITASLDPVRQWLGMSSGRPVIAVLPLDHAADVEDYIAADVTDSLNQALSLVEGLNVLSRTSVNAARRASGPLPQLAGMLGADLVLEGRLTRAGNVVTASLNLVAAPRDHTLLARTFRFTLPATERLQRDVLNAVCERLTIPLDPKVAGRAGRGGTERGDARDLYARGRFTLAKNSATSRAEAIEHFQQAIVADPGFALAHAALAQAYVMTTQPGDLSPSFELAERAVQTALALDSSLADAHAVLADIRMLRDWNWTAAEDEFQNAIALAPSLTTGYRYAMLLAARGRTKEAVERIVEDRKRDPLSLRVAVAVGTILQYDGRLAEALDHLEKAQRLDPDNPRPFLVKGRVLAALGRYGEARRAFLRAGELEVVDGPHYIQAEIAAIDAADDRRQDALDALVALEQAASSGGLDPTMVAFVHARLGQFDAAFSWLERAYAERSVRLVWLKVDPRFRPLAGDSRFAALVQRVGLG